MSSWSLLWSQSSAACRGLVLCGGVLSAGVTGCGPAVDTDGSGSSGAADASDDTSGGEPGGGEPGGGEGPGGASSRSTTAMTEPLPPDLDTDDAPEPPPEEVEIDGPYLVAMRASLAPETPFQYSADVLVVDDVLDLTLIPLSLSVGSTDAPREPLLRFALSFPQVPIASDGTFELDLPNTLIPAMANPVTGSDVVANIRVVGWFNGRRMCGNVSGEILSPVDTDLAGSSLAGIPVDNGVLPPVDDAQCG